MESRSSVTATWAYPHSSRTHHQRKICSSKSSKRLCLIYLLWRWDLVMKTEVTRQDHHENWSNEIKADATRPSSPSSPSPSSIGRRTLQFTRTRKIGAKGSWEDGSPTSRVLPNYRYRSRTALSSKPQPHLKSRFCILNFLACQISQIRSVPALRSHPSSGQDFGHWFASCLHQFPKKAQNVKRHFD